MPSKQERKAILRQLEEKVKEESDRNRPIGLLELGDLYDLLDSVECDHTLKHTRQFLKERGLDETVILPWFAEQGGFCDCEILANTEDRWNDRIESAKE